MLQPGDRFGNGFGLRHAHQSNVRRIEDALQGDSILRKHRHIDLPRNQCINCLRVIEIQQVSGIIQCVSGF